MAQQPPLLRDVIDIKESISTSDFVLSLAEATTPEGAQHALKDYVVTERLLENFDEALALIKSSLDGHRSKAAYLHGSFGSGKSPSWPCCTRCSAATRPPVPVPSSTRC